MQSVVKARHAGMSIHSFLSCTYRVLVLPEVGICPIAMCIPPAILLLELTTDVEGEVARQGF